MLLYFIGFIIGILAVLTFLVLDIYFNTRGLRRKDLVRTIEDKLTPKKGFVIDGLSEADEAREELINKNEEQGKGTPYDDMV